MKNNRQLDQKAYKPADGFIKSYQELIKNTVIPYQYEVLNDRAEGASKSHVVANFINAAKALRGEDTGDGFYGQVFQDSDAAKWIEAAAYSLTVIPDKDLEATVDSLIDIIADAQDKDGYLNTYYTIKDQDKRWTNLLEGHELYCAGHMMEAACAYYEATGKDKLLNVMLRNANHIYDVFITNSHEGYPGHPEIELALMRMYRLTSDKHCLELVKHFIDVRGVDTSYYRHETLTRGWSVWGSDGLDSDYNQSTMPIRQMEDIRGHAVRAVYLLTGVADYATEVGDEELFNVCKKLWFSITSKQMYITGGIGSTVHGEAFSVDYDLPSDTAYAETCASIGLMFFASRMLEKEVDSKYADIMERAFYNTVLGGIQLDGKKFFYVNPLEVIPGLSGVAKTHKHDLPTRPGWYDCACCPPNAARLISSFGKYAYSENSDTSYCHMYAAGTVSFENGLKISCSTNYPYDFNIEYKVLGGCGRLAIRIPSWSMNSYEISSQYELVSGYAYVDVSEGDTITISLNSNPYVVYANNKVSRLNGLNAICRGPLVYCFEGADNGDILSLCMNKPEFNNVSYDKVNELSGAMRIQLDLKRRIVSDDLYSSNEPEYENIRGYAIPYYTWGNRGENQMRVWLPMM